MLDNINQGFFQTKNQVFPRLYKDNSVFYNKVALSNQSIKENLGVLRSTHGVTPGM